jgi:hypothetical protein
MAATVLRVLNAFPAGQVKPPVTTPDRMDRPGVAVAVRWEDGRSGTVFGNAVGWTAEAVLVAFSGPDGLGRQEWFSVEDVRRT